MKKVNEVYVIEQPKSSLVTVIVVDLPGDKPLPQSVHERLRKLREISDLFFIFPCNLELKECVFLSLYQGCAWLRSLPELGPSLIKSLEYIRNVFSCHAGYCITLLSLLETTDIPENLVEINASAIVGPIFRIRPLDSEEYFKFWKGEEKKSACPKNPWWKFWKKKENDDKITVEIGEHCLYTSTSNFIFMRPRAVKELEGLDKNYVDSFKFTNDPRYLISSAFKKLGTRVLDRDIKDVSI